MSSVFDSIFGLSPVEKTIESATSDLLIASDWAKNAEIWELINRSKDNGKEYLKAIKSRLGHKNPKVVMLALILLEATVKNCRTPYHVLVSQKDYLSPLVKLGTKKESKSDVRDKSLSMIMSWAEAFQKSKDLQGFVTTYQELRKKGVEFPARDTTALAPVVTPPPKPRAPESAPAAGGAAKNTPNPHAHPYSYVSDAFISKTRTDLSVVCNFITIAREMLTVSDNSSAVKQNTTLLTVLRNLKEIDSRLGRLIGEINHELVVGLCIKLSEDIHSVLDWYQYRLSDTPYNPKPFVVPPELAQNGAGSGSGSGSGNGSGASPQQPAKPAANELNLFDRGSANSKQIDSKISPPPAAAGDSKSAPPLVTAAALAAADSKSSDAGDGFDLLAARDLKQPDPSLAPAPAVVVVPVAAASPDLFSQSAQRLSQSAARFPAPVVSPAKIAPPPELGFTPVQPAVAPSKPPQVASSLPVIPPPTQEAITFEPSAAIQISPSAVSGGAAPAVAGGGDGFDDFAALASRDAAAPAPAPSQAAAAPAVAAAAATKPRLTSDHVNADLSMKEFEQLLDLTDAPNGGAAGTGGGGGGGGAAASNKPIDVDLDELMRMAADQRTQHAAASANPQSGLQS